MNTYQAILDNARSRWAQEKGDWGDSADDKPLPKLLVGDTVLLLSYVTDVMAKFIKEYNIWGNDIHKEGYQPFSNDDSPLSVNDYLSRAVPVPGRKAYFRQITYKGAYGSGTFGPYTPVLSWDSGYGVIELWQQSVDLTASILSHHSPLETMDKYSCDTFIQFIDNVAFSLDKSNELPADGWQALGQALKAEASWTAQTTKDGITAGAGIAGDALAHAADTAGKAGGAFLQSFLSTAGITALAVTAAAIFIAMKVL